MIWQTSRFQIDLSTPRVMGIINAMPDSFSDGGKYFGAISDLSAIYDRCDQMVNEGADMLDIGGESTRPGAVPLPLDDELARVLPVVRHAVKLGVPVSVDTYKPQVMQAVLDLGVDVIIDIWALRQTSPLTGQSALQVVAQHPHCGVCLMHMHGEPNSMQLSPMQGAALPQVLNLLVERTAMLQALGVDSQRIVLDPGIGFGKTVEQNFELLACQRQLLAAGFPLLAGWSRKSSLAAVCSTSLASVAQLDVASRLVPSVTAALLAVDRGARVVRVHDVKETVQALKVWQAAAPPLPKIASIRT